MHFTPIPIQDSHCNFDLNNYSFNLSPFPLMVSLWEQKGKLLPLEFSPKIRQGQRKWKRAYTQNFCYHVALPRVKQVQNKNEARGDSCYQEPGNIRAVYQHGLLQFSVQIHKVDPECHHGEVSKGWKALRNWSASPCKIEKLACRVG